MNDLFTVKEGFWKACIHCGKTMGSHQAKTLACPMGKKHKTVGDTSYHPTNKFEEKK